MNNITCRPPAYLQPTDTCGWELQLETLPLEENMHSLGFGVACGQAIYAVFALTNGRYKAAAFHGVLALTCLATLVSSVASSSNAFPQTPFNRGIRVCSNVWLIGNISHFYVGSIKNIWKACKAHF